MSESNNRISQFDLLVAQPDCLTRHAKDFHRNLTKALSDKKSISVDCSQVVRMDISFAQLFVSAGRCFAENELTFQIVKATDIVAKTFADAGLGKESQALGLA